MPFIGERSKFFIKSFAFLFVPLFLLACPLFYHHSLSPVIGAYSLLYLAILITILGVFFGVSMVGALFCAWKRTFLPAFWIATGIVILSLGCLFLEIGFRLKFSDPFMEYARWGHKRSILFGFEAAPSHTWKAAGATYTTDSHGFRTHTSNPNWEIVPGLKIFILGGSSVFGYGLNDAETWPHRLEKKLQNDLKNVPLQIINAGNNGHNSLQALLRFYLKVLPFHPSFVLFYEGINDVNRKLSNPETVPITESILFSPSMTTYLQETQRPFSIYEKTIVGHSLSSRLRKLLGKSKKPSPNLSGFPLTQEEIIKVNGAHFIQNVITLALVCKINQVGFIPTTFLYDHERMDPYTHKTLQSYNDLLRNCAGQLSLPLIDLEKGFAAIPDQFQYFCDDHYHPNQKGAEYIAEQIEKSLLRQQIIVPK